MNISDEITFQMKFTPYYITKFSYCKMYFIKQGKSRLLCNQCLNMKVFYRDFHINEFRYCTK